MAWIELAKWLETIKISWSNQLAYRLNFILQILGPSIVFFFVKYNLWSAIFKTAQSPTIQGYDFSSMISYHIWVLVISLLAQSSNSIGISEDIRWGRISSYLIYPFSFWKFHTSGFFAHTGLQILICLVTLLIIALLNITHNFTPLAILRGFGVTLAVGFLWFSLQYCFGLMAFWFEETWVFRVIFMTTSAFLSGAIIPLEIYPLWFANLLAWTPFPYMTYIPAKIFMGANESFFLPLFILGFWTLFVWGGAALIWKKGLKHYTAAGM